MSSLPQTSFFSRDELKSIGLKSFGNNVNISRFARIYSPSLLSVGDDVRIDDFCIISGNVSLGNNVHISAYTALYGRCGISIGDFSGLSPRATVFSETDDFSGESMIGPMVAHTFRHPIQGAVKLCRFCQVGASSVVLPGVVMNEGAVTGAMTLVNKDLDAWSINVGVPSRFLRHRSRRVLDMISNAQ